MSCLFNCAASVLRIILFVFNFIFVLCGIILLVVGIVFKVQNSTINSIVDNNLDVAPNLFIAMGSLILVISFFGCCGAIKQNSCMLSTYAVFLLIILVLGVVVAALSFTAVDKSDLKTELDNELLKLVQNYSSDPQAQKAIDEIQLQFHCCGVNGPDDYHRTTNFPLSCCGLKNDTTTICSKTNANFYNNGCLTDVWESVTHFLFILGGIAIGFACVLIFGIITGFCLACSK